MSTEAQKLAARKYYHSHKEERKICNTAWRMSNKDYIRNKQRESKRLRKLEAIDYLGGRCSYCNNTFHPAVYEFHHRNPEEKDRDPSKMLQLSWERLKAELDKCDLVCANCHRLHHHGFNYQ